MIVDFVIPKIESVADWSILVALLGGVAFFFGKLISEVSPKKENAYATYVAGSVYLVLFVIFPPLILYTIFGIDFVKLPYIWALVIHYIIASYFAVRLRVYGKIQRLGLEEYMQNLSIKKTQDLLAARPKLAEYVDVDSSRKIYNWFFYRKMPKWLLFLMAIINYWLAASVMFSSVQPILTFISGLFLILTMSVLAVMSAWLDAKYPKVTVYFDTGDSIGGELAKIEDGFVNIRSGNKLYNIIDSKIKYIETEILTEQGKSQIEKTVFESKK